MKITETNSLLSSKLFCVCFSLQGRPLAVIIGALCLPPIIRRPHSNVISKYQSLVAAEKLDFDPIQLATVERLQNLQGRLDGYVPAPARSETGLLGRVSQMGLLGRVGL